MRLIDADALAFTHDYVTADGEPCITKAVIDSIPTIDAVPATIEGALGYLHKVGWMQEHDRIMTEGAVPVVRCKECKCWTEWDNGTGSCSRFALDWIGMDADDFCSMGERKDNEIDRR